MKKETYFLMLDALKAIRQWIGEQELSDNGEISIEAVTDLIDEAISRGDKEASSLLAHRNNNTSEQA